jgi:hypothetical protein
VVAAASDAAKIAELERTMVEPFIRGVGGDVLETGEVSRGAWWAHTYAAPTPSGTSDCTHWCMPGVPDLWVSALLEKLTERGELGAA